MSEYRMARLRRRVQYTLLAGLAGAFLIPQVSFAAPTGGNAVQGGATIDQSVANMTDITSSNMNNVITWTDYSVNSGETVRYDSGAKTNNYLNIVQGGNTSKIYGTITGGKDVYLVNPNGVIIGQGATVNVGNLHVSTQDTATLNRAAFAASGASPLSASAAGKADVVNMGTISATSVEVVGRSIRFLNDANVTVTSSPVVLRTDTANDGTAHIGYRGTAPATTKYKVNGAAATAGDNYYQLVRDATEMSDINTTNLAGNYMLENDIDMTGVTAPIGGNSYVPFTGKFDGNFYKIRNLNITGVDHAALFGRVSGARIENLGVIAPTIAGNDTGLQVNTAGGLIGEATGNTVLKNVYVEGGSITGESSRFGGIVGYTKNTKIDSSYNTSAISTNGGGIIGFADTGTEVTNTYNKPESDVPHSYFVRVIDPANGTKIRNSYTTSSAFSTTQSFTSSNVSGNFRLKSSGKMAPVIPGPTPSTTEYEANASSTYTGWDINNNGAPGAKWRIYEGRTAPLLTAFMSGTATATYNYRYFNADGTVDTDTGNTDKSNEGKDLTGLTYNSKYLKIVNPNAPTAAGDKSNVIYSGDVVDNNKVHDYINTGTKDYDKTNGIRNVGTKAILWSDQDGPNLRGVNVTIDKRQVKLKNGNINPNRMYNGKKDVTDAFIQALKSGSISSDGFTQDDINAGSVQLDFTTGNFKAQMADKNVGTDKEVTFTGSIGFSGTDEGNYEFDGGSINNLKGKATITKAPLYLTIHKKTADAKIYDGTSVVKDDAMKQSGGTPNIALDKTKTAPLSTAIDQTIPDGAIMRDDSNNLDTVDLKNIADPKYTDGSGTEQIHKGAHKLQYTGVGLRTDGAYANDAQNYELFYTPASGTKTAVTSETVYLDGTIKPREIKTDGFKVYKKSDNTEASAQKVYNGNNEYILDTGNLYLSANTGATTDTTGIVSRDQGHITFALTGGKGQFRKSDGTTATKNVQSAAKIAYNVTGQSDNPTEYQLGDYYVKVNSVETPISNTFNALGAGKITPKALAAAVKNNHITKVYDAMQEQTDGSQHVIKGDALVTITGYVGSEKRTNTSTATYASKDVVVDGAGNPTAQDVTYNVSFDKGTGEESDNYTLDQTANTTNVTNTQTLSNPGVYTGTITPRDLTMKFNDVTKVYDGTAENTDKTLASLDDGLSGAVIGADGISAGSITMPSGVTSSYGKRSGTTFTDNLNAGAHDVEYRGLSNALGTSNHNYKIADKQYGTGTITRRRIDKSGFRVYNADNTVADATKVYDGNNRHTLAPGAYLTGTAASGDTGIVTRDYGKVTFALKTGSTGHFSSDADGNNRTSHVSEAQYVAYDVVARTSDATNNPLTNYTFGSAAEETAGTLRNLETVNDTNPAHVTAAGHITPASIRAKTHAVEKVYDGMAEHTDGNRNIKRGSDIVSLATMITDETDGQPTNTSTAAYADKNVARDGGGNIINKDVTYTAQLTGKYAADYKIVDAGNTVISTVSGTGANKTLTANAGTVTNAGKITPRKLNIKMGDVSKTYDGTSTNTDSSVTEITDAPQTAVIGTILTGDSITTGALKIAWDNKRSGGTASSSYGNGTGSAFRHNANASNGTPHDVRYTKMDEAFKDAFGTTTAGNYTVDKTVYGKGTINRKAIDPNNFDIVDEHGNASPATKVYDGTSNYAVPSGWNLRPSTGHGTGVITDDEDKISFAIDPNKGAHFTKADNTTRTANAYEAQRVAYNVKATADNGYEYLLKNYTLNGQNLESGNATATGAGTITRRTINVGLAETSGIDKAYDGNANLIDTANRHHQVFSDDDGRANVGYATDTTNANKLVRTKNGYTVDDGAQVTVQGSYTGKNVARDGSGNVTTKSITYKVKIAEDAGKNYYLTDGSTTVNAETELELSATGKITPRDLSGAFKKVTKDYDGTKYVDPSKVGFEIGANGVVSGDAVGLASGHTQEFESENVRGSGTTWTAPDGTTQHNWVNYSGLTLSGTDAGNYNLGSTARGLGEITPYVLNPTSVDFSITQASKTYDGTNTVKWTDGSSTLSDQKKYITSATVNINGNPVNVLDDLKLISATYDKKDVNNGRFADRVTYNLSYTGTSGNFSLGGNATIAPKGDGIITKKDVTVTVKSPLTKTYDATTDVLGTAKNSANVIVSNANDIISMTGLTGNDGATNESTATFDDPNAGTGKVVNYDVKLDTANAGNYNLKYNGAVINPPISTNDNTITKRKVDVAFAPVSKSYDGTPANTSITPSVSAADAAVLSQDNAARVSGTTITGLTGVTSQYGTGTTDATFTPDRNAGAKSVQYAGLGAAMGTAFGANNYEFATNGYGTGTITKANINTSDITFATTGAHKVYDGTRTVKYNGSSAKADVKNYITTATANLGGGHTADLRGDLEIDETGTHYSSPNATNGTPDTVTYKFRLKSNNIEISGKNEFEMTDTGTIDRRVLNLDLAQKTGINKIYDANENLVDTDTRHYDKFIDDDAKGNVTYAFGTTNDNKLVRTANGAEVNDGAAMTIRTNYVDAGVADKNAGINKDIAYNVRIGGAQGQNYTLSYNGTTEKAEIGLDLTGASGTIAKRKITLGFGDVQKMYDTTPNNNTKNITSVTAGNTDGRGAATLTADGITSTSFDTTGIVSYYGAGTTDVAFQRNPNVVTDANGNVIPNGKDVQYSNLANTLAAQPYAVNYEIANTAYGKGTIHKRIVTANDFTFNINNAKKMYDGTKDVYWEDTVTGKSYKDMAHVKNYFNSSTLDLGGGNTVPINLDDIDLNSAQYNNKNVALANGVKYNVTINTKNFEFSGTRTRDIDHTGDTITKRDLAKLLPEHLVKEYDGKQTFDETNRDYVNALANENITHIVKADQGKIQLAVTGTYSNKDASAETKGDAQKGIHLPAAPNGRKVKYTLTLSGDADTLANYTIDGHDTTYTVAGKAADIYKRTLTVDVGRKVKDYDATAAVKGLTTSDITFHNLAEGETLSPDPGALAKVQGQYLDSNGNADANVSRDVHRNVLDKAVKYTGFDNALSDLATRNNTAKNYRVEGGSKSYTVNDAKGRINPLSINDPSNDVKMKFAATGPSKTYDREPTVKYKGLGTKEALKNYLTDATVMVGGQTRSIKDEIEIDPTKTHYDDKNAGTGKTVTYGFKYKGDNFEIADFTKPSDVKGEIRRKDVKVLPVDQLWKTYDSERDVYVEGDDSIFTRHGGKQGKRVTTGDSVLELEPNGIISGDVVQNDSWAEFTDENAGTGKKVKYHTSFSGTDAANYRFVDVSGGEITKPLETNNNTIAKRKLNIVFDGLKGTPPVQKFYDATSANNQVTARITDDPNGHTRTVLQRDGMDVFGDRLAQLNNGNIQSDYGEGKTDQTFRSDPNAGHKDVQYRGVGKALRNILGGYADNYEPVPDNAYSDGEITKADVSRNEFDPNFTHAHKEYDGTSDVQNLDERYDEARSFWNAHKLDQSNIESLTGSYRGTSSKRGKDVGTNKIVDYTLKLSNRNFNFVGWDGVIQKEGTGDITPRELTADYLPKQTKVYDGTKNIASVGDSLVTFRHKSGANAFINGDKVRNSSTATYGDANVAWQDNAWKNGDGTVADKDVDYDLRLSGTDATNYKIVDEKGNEIASTTRKTGRITPKEIHLKADPQTRWINEGLPDSYTGTPTGKDYATGVNGEALPGEIYYNSPDGRLRWGDYAINGYYRPSDKAQYQRPDGTRYQLADGTYDGDSVARNYRFVQDPANATALHIGPYVPDTDYYQALTQTSKMLPDEYAYENASLDRRSHFGRDPEAEISYEPPSLNMVKDGVDISKNGIEITDETVFRLVNEVFGA